MFLMADSPLNQPSPWALPRVFKRLGFSRSAHTPVRAVRQPRYDGYLLVLLADQELEAGRGDQARSLLDAAYAGFDEGMAADSSI
jgi:hypothetical protein